MMNTKDWQENSKRRTVLVNLVYKISNFRHGGKVPSAQGTSNVWDPGLTKSLSHFEIHIYNYN